MRRNVFVLRTGKRLTSRMRPIGGCARTSVRPSAERPPVEPSNATIGIPHAPASGRYPTIAPTALILVTTVPSRSGSVT